MKSAKYIVPNTLTVLNLMCGIAAIISLFESQPERPYLPVVLLLCAAVFDVFDGLVAKLMNATSEFGKQLDSLADLVSFGVAPAIMVYKLLVMALIIKTDSADFLIESANFGQRALLYSALLVAAFTALRLARFNISAPTSDFIGLPVPASALIVSSVWLIFHLTSNEKIHSFILSVPILLILIGFVCVLMVSKLPMLSLKFKGAGMRENIWRYVLVLGAIVIISVFRVNALLFVMLYYILLSLIATLTRKK